MEGLRALVPTATMLSSDYRLSVLESLLACSDERIHPVY
jgi:hypothetical protein